MNQQLSDYINQSRKAGATDEQIKQALATAGWPEQDIKEAMSSAAGFAVSSPIVPRATLETDQQSFINKWSWGGFLLYFVYFLGCRNYKRALLYFLGTAVPILDIYLWIKSGLRGRKLIWESGKWQDFESYHKRQKLLDKIGFALVLVAVLIWITFFAFGYVSLLKKGNQAVVQPVGQEISPTSSAVQAVVPVPDLFAGIKVTLDKFNQIKSMAEITPLFSRASQKLLAQSKGSFTPGTKYEFENGTMNTVGDEAQVKVKTTESGKVSEEQTVIFVLENGLWKIDIPKTIEQQFETPYPSTPTSSSGGGSTDLAVLDLQITPNPPKAGDPNTDVEFRFKNIGSVTIDKCINYKWKWTVGGQQETGGGSNCSIVRPGKIISVGVSPTFYFLSKNISPGPRTIHVELNYDNVIKETSKSNNILDQTIQFLP